MRGGGERIIAPQKGGHSSQRVHLEMMLTICRWYTSLPDVRELSASEIRTFYNGLRDELKKNTQPQG